jgi:hypothetical protein
MQREKCMRAQFPEEDVMRWWTPTQFSSFASRARRKEEEEEEGGGRRNEEEEEGSGWVGRVGGSSTAGRCAEGAPTASRWRPCISQGRCLLITLAYTER